MKKDVGRTLIIHLLKNDIMNKAFRTIYLALTLGITGYFGYSLYYGKAFWESSTVQKNTEYTGRRFYGGYGNRLNHK